MECGHGEREPGAREGGESKVRVEVTKPVHGGVAKGDCLPSSPEGEPHVGHPHPGPRHPVILGQALRVKTLGGKLVTVGTHRCQLQPLLHII